MIQWPMSVIDDIARRRSVIFLGSGISKQAENDHGQRPKTWREFLESALTQCPTPRKHISRLINDGDYLTACEIIKSKMGAAFNNFVFQEFAAPGFKPAKIHTDIVLLDSRIVATPNFDKLYDTEATVKLKGTVKVKNYYDADVASTIRGDDFVILKVHGTVDSPPDLIFTREQYTTARYKYANFYSVLDALALTHTFLFLGAGLSDPDIRLLLENHSNRSPHSRPHVMVAPKGSLHRDVKASIERSLNLSLIFYNPDNHHQELADSIAQLVLDVEARRSELARDQKW